MISRGAFFYSSLELASGADMTKVKVHGGINLSMNQKSSLLYIRMYHKKKCMLSPNKLYEPG